MSDDRKIINFPIRAQRVSVRREVADHAYIECDDLPDFSHGIVWAHSLGQSPPDLFGEMLAAIDRRLSQVRTANEKQGDVGSCASFKGNTSGRERRS